jgi:hypothetical protein
VVAPSRTTLQLALLEARLFLALATPNIQVVLAQQGPAMVAAAVARPEQVRMVAMAPHQRGELPQPAVAPVAMADRDHKAMALLGLSQAGVAVAHIEHLIAHVMAAVAPTVK